MDFSETQHRPTTNRRGFFAGSLGISLVLGGPARGIPGISNDRVGCVPSSAMGPYESILQRTDRLDILGVPRSWSAVEQGLHPFTPERIAVVQRGERPRFGSHLKPGWRARVERRIDECRQKLATERSPSGLSAEKLESLLWVANVMSGHYKSQDVFEDWAVGIANREMIGSTGCGDHWGLVHQFQGNESEVDCPPIDWWLFLFPDDIRR
jgi:hypothetical protein